MHIAELSAVEQRVLGCLIEKRWTTPDQYPLSLNALRLACNQSTNRDPVTDYGDTEVSDAAQRLSRYGLARLASGAGSRATKYRHLAEEALGLDREQLAIVCVLLLRGPQTPGELKARSERMAHLPTLNDVDRVLDQLADRGYCERLARRPGQKEDRYRQLLGGGAAAAAAGADEEPPIAAAFDENHPAPPGAPAPPTTPTAPASTIQPDLNALEARVGALEAEVTALRVQLAELLD
ncbi:MAG: YceH family protein [Solirubrobacteraceae bacterium]